MTHLKCDIGEYAIVINQKVQALIVQLKEDSHHPLHWMLPGGRLEEGDSAGKGIVRELKEETNLDITVISPCHVARWGSEDPVKYTVFFLCTCIKPEKIMLNHENRDFKWISFDEIHSVKWLNEHFPMALQNAKQLIECHVINS